MNGKLENDILKLHELIDGLQKQINILISAEDEVRELKKILVEKNLQIPIIEKELKDTKERHEESLKKLQLEHSRNISEMARSFTEERDEMVNELKQQLEEERDKNKQLQGTLKNQEEKKQNEIVCLKMEFETKMKLLQRQKNQSALSKQSCDQEIFRKKLSHMKEEYEKKISELEQSVSSLEWKLSEAPVLPLRERLQLFSNNSIIDKIKKKKSC
ncbi:coiled-coil domain-containing protein 152 [Octopus bimaculoides]|nr:coiled-coil domain-containing protein 152 [Octopus bimaculoides]|eukprot:XP_014770785.1 PREDICTED: coiled-coil domain-containing protein 152-like [Octopus bimaculoides]